jgi:phosphoribosylformylglycinamidine cyclo-ligase
MAGYDAGTYNDRGVSAGKADVHKAIQNLDKGLYPDAFCKILPDLAAGDEAWCNILHADTAGTKTSLAYLYWRETGDLSVWKGIVQDAIVMNLDDMACAGLTGGIILSSTIGRNKFLIPGEVLQALIGGTQQLLQELNDLGIGITLAGGETADAGDIVRTVDVGFTAFGRMRRADVQRIRIQPGAVIVGFASDGQATYEQAYNSGIGCNGLTYARHEMLGSHYAQQYPESYDPGLKPEVVYQGPHRLTDPAPGGKHTIGQWMLAPTRTYLPLLKQILPKHAHKLQGIVHCTGGGQTKVLHFAQNLHVVKDNLMPLPPLFQLMQQARGAQWQELFQVFNMGHRLEIYTDADTARELIAIAASLNIKAAIVGRTEALAGGKRLTLTNPQNGAVYTY